MSEMATSSRQSSVDEDEEVFEITDFTNVSDWEKFMAQITEAVSDWQLTCIENVRPLHKDELTKGTWEQIGKEIRFSNAIFMLTLYRLQQSDAEEVYLEEGDPKLEDELRLPLYMDDMMSGSNDFPPRAHCLARWYGFRSFLVLSLISSGSKTATGLTSESKCNLLLSSASIVLSESGCEVPIFIQIQQNWRKMFTGRCVGTGMQTEFEMVHLKKCPPQYHHLSGLLHVFKSKIGATVSPVQVSARFTYVMSNWGGNGTWPVENIDPEDAASKFDTFLFGALDDPIGDLQLSAIWPSVTEDLIVENDVHSDFDPNSAPVWTVRLHYTDNPECLLSSYLSELLKLRSCKDSMSDLISTTVKTQESSQDIGNALSKLTDTSHKMKHIVPLVPELTSGISRIVTTHKSIWKSRIQASSLATVGPISQDIMEAMMEFLFSASEEDVEKEESEEDYKKAAFVHEMEHQLKSAPKNSLTHRLALCATVVNYCHGGMAAVAQLWHEFIQEMRYRFENGINIPGIKSESPDLRCCLLHQKLQMLNCCIQHKISREKHNDSSLEDGILPQDAGDSTSLDPDVHPGESETNKEQEHDKHIKSSKVLNDDKMTERDAEKENPASTETKDYGQSPPQSPGWREETSSIDEDEFFECEDGEFTKEPENPSSIQEAMETDDAYHSITANGGVNIGGGENAKSKLEEEDGGADIEEDLEPGEQEESMTSLSSAIGRLKPVGSLRLLKCNELLYIPVTQEPAPLTEDALEEQTKIFSSLGDSAEGALLRRKMQSASLLSDMESFKAANPNCCLEDFVRWYSPRDYEEVTGTDGKVVGTLSDRMKIPGNLWQTMWETAKPIPARRQKRLFDDTREGEKVLHFLSSLQPKNVVLFLLPMCFHEAIDILRGKSQSSVPSVPKLCQQITTHACKLFQSNYMDKSSQMDDLLQKILFTETMIERTSSLKHKFSFVKNCDTFVKHLVEHPEVMLEGGANGEVGKLIREYFRNQSDMNREPPIEGVEHRPRSALPPPCGREYILRTMAPRPSSQSRSLPHRIYAVLMKNEFRLAGAFSSDTVFF